MKNLSNEINYSSLIQIISQKETVSYKKDAIDFIKAAKKKYEIQKLTYSNSLSQGLKLIKDIYLKLTELKKKYVVSTYTDRELLKEKLRTLDNEIDSFIAETEVIWDYFLKNNNTFNNE